MSATVYSETIRWKELTCGHGSTLPLIFSRLLYEENGSTIVVATAELLYRGEVRSAVGVDKVASTVHKVDAIDRAIRCRVILSG